MIALKILRIKKNKKKKYVKAVQVLLHILSAFFSSMIFIRVMAL